MEHRDIRHRVCKPNKEWKKKHGALWTIIFFKTTHTDSNSQSVSQSSAKTKMRLFLIPSSPQPLQIYCKFLGRKVWFMWKRQTQTLVVEQQMSFCREEAISKLQEMCCLAHLPRKQTVLLSMDNWGSLYHIASHLCKQSVYSCSLRNICMT